jgi:hypothetical protein
MAQQTSHSSPRIPWHPAFVQAIKLELEPYKDVLEFKTEYRLTSEPLEIDVVIVKKSPEAVIEKNIAQVFKRINILEYKSPEDYFSVYDFYKVLSYAFLYAALNKTYMEDLTITIIETRHPRELFTYLGKNGNRRAEEVSPGIYHISGYPVVIQVIEGKKLPLAENLWLKGLTTSLNAAVADIILKESRKRGKEAELAAYMYALISANTETIEEVYQMANGKLSFEELMEKIGLAAEWEKRGEARGEARGKAIGEAKGEKIGWEKAVELLKKGYTVEQLEQMSPSSP